MSFQLNISAGELFELIRPAALVLSALLSIWVLASARQHGFPLFLAAAWALGTLFFPLVILPLYLIARFVWKRQRFVPQAGTEAGKATVSRAAPRWRNAVPLAYAAVVLLSIAFYLYLDYQTIDAHLARATQAKVMGNRGRTIGEYRAALKIEDNPHTRKLLAIELAETGDWIGALSEFRQAEQGGEPNELIAFRIANLLDLLNLPHQATLEYQRFLQSKACTQLLPDTRCGEASARVSR